ncbi:MAG: hypothetical protein ACRD0G_19600 [Acidimicrobiales bacterium]
MLVRSDRRYRFDVDADEVWAAICAVDDYRRWWPWLRGFDARGLHEGDVWTCVVQPPLPYALRFAVALDAVDAPRYVAANVSGDIVGEARLHLDGDGDGSCDVRVVSALAPASRTLRALARVARPVVRFGHDWVFDTGARQFRSRAL